MTARLVCLIAALHSSWASVDCWAQQSTTEVPPGAADATAPILLNPATGGYVWADALLVVLAEGTAEGELYRVLNRSNLRLAWGGIRAFYVRRRAPAQDIAQLIDLVRVLEDDPIVVRARLVDVAEERGRPMLGVPGPVPRETGCFVKVSSLSGAALPEGFSPLALVGSGQLGTMQLSGQLPSTSNFAVVKRRADGITGVWVNGSGLSAVLTLSDSLHVIVGSVAFRDRSDQSEFVVPIQLEPLLCAGVDQ